MKSALIFAPLLTVCVCLAQSAIKISTTSLPDGIVGVPYAQTIAASGGPEPHTFAITSGSLPSGLSLSDQGAVSGTPADTGTSRFTVQARDASGKSDTQALSITVNPAVRITTTSIPSGIVGQDYSQTLSASGGTPPFRWTVASGALPGGVSLSPSGALSGKPRSAGTSSFTAQVTDSKLASDSQGLTLLVNPALSITTDALPAGTTGAVYSQSLTIAVQNSAADSRRLTAA
jgi:hypothetical protein